jgi:hypothetical protein
MGDALAADDAGLGNAMRIYAQSLRADPEYFRTWSILVQRLVRVQSEDIAKGHHEIARGHLVDVHRLWSVRWRGDPEKGDTEARVAQELDEILAHRPDDWASALTYIDMVASPEGGTPGRSYPAAAARKAIRLAGALADDLRVPLVQRGLARNYGALILFSSSYVGEPRQPAEAMKWIDRAYEDCGERDSVAAWAAVIHLDVWFASGKPPEEKAAVLKWCQESRSELRQRLAGIYEAKHPGGVPLAPFQENDVESVLTVIPRVIWSYMAVGEVKEASEVLKLTPDTGLTDVRYLASAAAIAFASGHAAEGDAFIRQSIQTDKGEHAHGVAAWFEAKEMHDVANAMIRSLERHGSR